MAEPGIWLTSILAGLGGAAHCAAMCGPLTLALGASPATSGGSAGWNAAGFNIGRLLGYLGAGALAYAALGHSVHAAHWAEAAAAFRLVAAAMVAAVGLSLLGLPWLSHLERGLMPAWSLVRRALAPLSSRLMYAPALIRPVLFGLFWLLMPCGLVASVLLVAASRDSLIDALLVVFCFGIGTLPAVLSLSFAGSQIGHWLRRPPTRRILGLLLVLAALYSGFVAMEHGGFLGAEQHHHHHGDL
jgi:sulfite exporter TauE/SafE